MTLLDDISDYSNYKSVHRSILMFDEQYRRMRKIGLEDGLRYSGLFNEDGSLRPVQGDNVSLQDLRDDFLTFQHPGDGGRPTPIEYIFDMAPEYFSAKHVIRAGESLAASLTRRVPALAAVRANLTLETLDTLGATAGILVEALRTTLGADGYLFENLENNANILASLFAGGLAPVVPEGGGGEENLQSKVDTGLFNVLKSVAPKNKGKEIDTLVSGPGSVLDRADAIRAKIGDYIKGGVAGTTHKSEEELHNWYGEQLNLYRDHKRREQDSAPVSGEFNIRIQLDSNSIGFQYD